MSCAESAENAEAGWYSSPLYYDIIFDQGTSHESDFLEAAFHIHAEPRASKSIRLLEPACGSGRLLAELAARGHAVTGFDLEPAMVDFSRERLSLARHKGAVFRMGMEQFTVPGIFDMAYCLVSTFKYLRNERDARSHLRHVARHLRRGGIYLLGFHLSDYDQASEQREHWKGSRGKVNVDCVIDSGLPDQIARVEKIVSKLTIRENDEERTMKTQWEFRTYDAEEVRAMLQAVPEFTLVKCYDFCYDVNEPRTLDDPWEDVILVLKKN